jgi:hypothetical protein
LLTIPCIGERKTSFMPRVTIGGTDGVWDISASFLWFCLFSQVC